MKNKITAILLLLSNMLLKSYGAYEKGYIVTNTGDTLSGKIQYKNWNVSPSTIRFLSENKQEKIVSVEDIKLFYVALTNEYFYAKNFRVEYLTRDVTKGAANFKTINDYGNREKKYIEAHAFVRMLVRGKVNLYIYLNEKYEDNFLLIEKNDVVVPLENHRAIFGDKVRTFPIFQEQLRTLFSNEMPNEKFDELRYTEASLLEFVEKYNKEQTGESGKLEKNNFSFQYGPVVMYITEKWLIQNESNVYSEYANNDFPSIGFSATALLGKRRFKWGAIAEAYYYRHNSETAIVTRGYDITYSLQMQGVKLFAGPRLAYCVNEFKFIADVGLNVLVIPFKKQFTESYKNAIYGNNDLEAPSSTFHTGLGLNYKKIELLYRSGKTKVYQPITNKGSFLESKNLILRYWF